jgi:hypothetical protein
MTRSGPPSRRRSEPDAVAEPAPQRLTAEVADRIAIGDQRREARQERRLGARPRAGVADRVGVDRELAQAGAGSGPALINGSAASAVPQQRTA